MEALRKLRKTARITQLELSRQTGIDRMRLSLCECGYLSLTKAEQAAVMHAIAAAADSHATQVRRAF